MRVYLLICDSDYRDTLHHNVHICSPHLQSNLDHINLPGPPYKMWKNKYDLSYTVQYFSMIHSGRGPPLLPNNIVRVSKRVGCTISIRVIFSFRPPTRRPILHSKSSSRLMNETQVLQQARNASLIQKHKKKPKQYKKLQKQLSNSRNKRYFPDKNMHLCCPFIIAQWRNRNQLLIFIFLCL